MKINDIYKCSGKKYNGEKAIISMTSWSERIATCPKTIFSLLKQCPGFHIVLVLSEEEFPKMEEELPEELMLFVNNKLIELLWIYKNYKSFKKVVFTANKYKDVPIISADDDCIYKYNYAEELYNTWKKNKECLISAKASSNTITYSPWGFATLHPPGRYNLEICEKIFQECLDKDSSHDDAFYGFYNSMLKTKLISLKHEWKHVADVKNNQHSLNEYRKKHPVNHGKILQDAFIEFFNVKITK